MWGVMKANRENIWFTQKDICNLTGLTPRQVLNFASRSLITPDIEEAEGKGRPRRYSLWNLFQFRVVRELVGFGMDLYLIRSIIDQFSDHFLQGPNGLSCKNFDPKSVDPNTWLLVSYKAGIVNVVAETDLLKNRLRSMLLIDLYWLAKGL